jgi:hypothetical protein
MYLRSLFLTILTTVFSVPSAMAANYEFEGTLLDGRTVWYSTETPSTVYVYQKAKDGSIKNYDTYDNEKCEVTDAMLKCSLSGKSPLAGSTYKFQHLVGKPNDCGSRPIYAVYQCIKGCSKSRLAPSIMKEDSYCG